VRTSNSDPLRIDEVNAGDAGGLIGITLCPGKCDRGSRWARDLATDLDVIAAWQPRAMVTLIEGHDSALPVAYSRVPRAHWRALASLVLESAYEATLWAGVDSARRGGSNVVLLTLLGGGAFGNDDEWIHAAIRRAIRNAVEWDLDVKLVSYGPPSSAMLQLVGEFAWA
jgi:hypothetical protein